MFAGLALVVACGSRPAETVVRWDDDGILAAIWNSEDSDYRAEHREYERLAPLEFSNGATVRTRWSLEGTGRVDREESGRLRFPDGTIISKEFSFPVSPEFAGLKACRKVVVGVHEADERADHPTRRRCLVELRVLARWNGRWHPFVFEWTDEGEWRPAPGGRSLILRTNFGDSKRPVEVDYSIPSLGECHVCHAGRRDESDFGPIALKVDRLSTDSLVSMLGVRASRIEVKRRGEPWSSGVAEERLAREYLDVNCGYCHNPNGVAMASALMLDRFETDRLRLGICKVPVAVSFPEEWGTWDIEPGSPERSLLLRRMSSLDPLVAMPELGRSLIDAEGVGLISNWIAIMSKGCDSGEPRRVLPRGTGAQ